MICDEVESAESCEGRQGSEAVRLSGCNVAGSSVWRDRGFGVLEEALIDFKKAGVSTLMTVKATPGDQGWLFQ